MNQVVREKEETARLLFVEQARGGNRTVVERLEENV